MVKKTSFKNWSKFDKAAVSFVLGMVAFCGVCTSLYLKEKDYRHVAFHGACTLINAACATKIVHDARKQAKERN